MYRELRAPAGMSHLACGWVADGVGASVLPDGCVDVVLSAGRLIVAGPATAASAVAPTPGQYRCGVRFRVGAALAGLGVPADVLRDVSVQLEELWGAEGRRLSEAVAEAETAEVAVVVLGRALAQTRAPLDPLARQAALLATSQPFHQVSRELGVSERQLRRRVERAVGYGPRTLARILRLQRFLRGAEREAAASLARLAADAGYADHAHLARECRRLTGRTPSTLLAGGATAAGERASDSFKPDLSQHATLRS